MSDTLVPQIELDEIDLFNPGSSQQRVIKEFEKRQRSSKFLPETFRKANESINAINEAYVTRIKQLDKKADQEFEKADEAFNRLENISQNPRIFTQIMGLFDSDFNPGTQRKKIERARFNLGSIQLKQQRTAEFRNIGIATAEQLKQSAKEFYTFNRQGFVDAVELAKFGFTVDEQVRKQTLEKVIDANNDTLTKWLKDTDQAPADLRNRRGLIEIELLRRKAAETQLDIQELALNRQQRNFAIRKFMDNLPSLASAEKALANPKTLPDNIPPGALRDEINRLKDIDIILQTHDAALQTNNLRLQEAMKATLFQKLSSADVQEALQREEKGIIQIGKFQFTRAEMRTLLATKQKQEAEENKVFTNAIIAATELETSKLALDDRLNTYAAVLNPEAASSGREDLPAETQTQLLDTEMKVNALEPLKNQPGVASESAAILKAQIEILDTRIEDTIKNNYTEAQQPAVREFATKRRIDNAENAAAYLASNVGNPSLLDQSFELGTAWRLFSEAFAPISSDILASIQIEGIGEVPIAKGKRPIAVQIQAALDAAKTEANPGGVKSIYASQMTQSLMRSTLATMINNAPEVDQSVLSQFLNPRTGNLSSAFFRNTETGKVFNTSLFLEETARATEIARKGGIIGVDEDFASMILDTMNANIKAKIAQVFQNSLNAAAFNTVVLGNRPAEPIFNSIRAVEAQIPISLKNARDLTKSLERLMQQKPEPSLTDPGAAP